MRFPISRFPGSIACRKQQGLRMKLILEHIIAPTLGFAFVLERGQTLRVIDLEGKQVVDMALFNAANPREKLSTSYSRTRYIPKLGASYIPRDKLTEGDLLLSTICKPMMTIIRETPEPKGVHDVHNRMCNRLYYEMYNLGSRDGCHENISRAVAPYGLLPEDIPDTMDLFMNYHHDCARGRWVIEDPVSKPGDYIEFRAEMHCIVGFSNCPNEAASGGRCTAVKVEVYAPDGATRREVSARS